jgi:CRISPR-associated protein Cmr3
MVSDYTGEALALQLQTQEDAGLGLLINRDELKGLFGSLNAYRGGRGADEEQLLELFDGSGLTSLRIKDGGRQFTRSQLSIWGSTQPDVLRELVAKGDANGLWARFLFVPLPERAVPLPLATSATEVAEVEDAAATLANACGAVYRLPRQIYRLAPAAAERFADYELGRQRAALGATIGAQSALYGKSAGKVLRLAGVLHLLKIAAGEISSSAAIEPGTIERAAILVDHLDAWALGLHAEVAAGGVGQLMRTVHRAAEAAAGALRWRELVVKMSAKQRKETDAAAFAEAARALAAAGYGEVEQGKRGAISYRATSALP